MCVTDRPSLLIVDDDGDIRSTLCAHLERSGFQTTSAKSAADARVKMAAEVFDLCVLDIMMPGEDGLSLCRHLRVVDNMPVILLTALSDDTDKIVGLEVGADDYLAKPFNPRELVARIRAVLRRVGDQPKNKAKVATTRFGKWSLDEQQSELTRNDGVVVTLSAGELAVLSVFIAHPGEVLSRDDIMRLTRGRETLAFERTIDNVISRLRKKIEDDPANPRFIKTVRGGGYRLVSTVLQ